MRRKQAELIVELRASDGLEPLERHDWSSNGPEHLEELFGGILYETRGGSYPEVRSGLGIMFSNIDFEEILSMRYDMENIIAKRFPDKMP